MRSIAAVGIWSLLAGGLAGPASAQQVAVGQVRQELRARAPQPPTELDQQRAEVTREELRELLRRYPPALGRVLRADPSLLSNTVYLAPYPALATYLERHPEVARYPDYFLNYFNYDYQEPAPPEVQMRRDAMNMWRDMFFSIMVFAGLLSAALTLGWLIRYVVGHRRWLRSVKIQTEVHSRLMERFGSNDELMTYIQSPAGRQFLQGLPAAPEMASESAAVGAPLTRILWSVQAGIVLVCAGVGLLTIKRYMVDEVAEMLLVWGVLSLSIGFGFVLAAGASYMLSHRLGLFDAAHDSGAKGA
jgi:hypothetical protein